MKYLIIILLIIPIKANSQLLNFLPKKRGSNIVIIKMGESNSGSYGKVYPATSEETDPHPRLQLWDNSTNAGFIASNIPENNMTGHKGGSLYAGSSIGWENTIGTYVNADSFGVNRIIYEINTGQGGSTVSDWVDHNYVNYDDGDYQYNWDVWNARVGGASSKLHNINGNANVYYIMFSLGINDALAHTDSITFKNKLITLIGMVRSVLPGVPFYATKIMTYDSYFTGINWALTQVSQQVSGFTLIETEGVERTTAWVSAYHWGYYGTKTIASRMLYYILKDIKQRKI